MITQTFPLLLSVEGKTRLSLVAISSGIADELPLQRREVSRGRRKIQGRPTSSRRPRTLPPPSPFPSRARTTAASAVPAVPTRIPFTVTNGYVRKALREPHQVTILRGGSAASTPTGTTSSPPLRGACRDQGEGQGAWPPQLFWTNLPSSSTLPYTRPTSSVYPDVTRLPPIRSPRPTRRRGCPRPRQRPTRGGRRPRRGRAWPRPPTGTRGRSASDIPPEAEVAGLRVRGVPSTIPGS